MRARPRVGDDVTGFERLGEVAPAHRAASPVHGDQLLSELRLTAAVLDGGEYPPPFVFVIARLERTLPALVVCDLVGRPAATLANSRSVAPESEDPLQPLRDRRSDLPKRDVADRSVRRPTHRTSEFSGTHESAVPDGFGAS